MELPTFLQSQNESLKLAAQAALAAGEIIREGYAKVHAIDSKGIGDLVSQVDFDADRAATEILLTDPSGLPIVSEELNPEANDINEDMWIVDPLDGTTAYLVHAGPQYSSVLVALRRDGETALGITYFPMTDEWFYAVKGKGAWKNGRRMVLDDQVEKLGDAWVEMNQYGNVQFETEFFRSANLALRSHQGARIVTSTFPHAGVAMRIAEQKSGLCCAIHDNNPDSLKQGPWDIAANQVIFEEAGGLFVNPNGNRINPFVAEPIIIATNQKLADEIIRVTHQYA